MYTQNGPVYTIKNKTNKKYWKLMEHANIFIEYYIIEQSTTLKI